MRRFLAFFALAFCAAIVITACNSNEQGTGITSPVSSGTPNIAADGVRRITVAELRDLIAKDEAFVVDVRSLDVYKTGHIRGAKLIPTNETLNHVNELPKDKLIVTYCS